LNFPADQKPQFGLGIITWTILNDLAFHVGWMAAIVFPIEKSQTAG
jgi:hypothetical protein